MAVTIRDVALKAEVSVATVSRALRDHPSISDRTRAHVVAVANDVPVLHVRGVSSRSRPVFVEWHKHRGLWRYFSKFEAPRRGLATRVGVFAAIWTHFLARLPRALVPR